MRAALFAVLLLAAPAWAQRYQIKADVQYPAVPLAPLTLLEGGSPELAVVAMQDRVTYTNIATHTARIYAATTLTNAAFAIATNASVTASAGRFGFRLTPEFTGTNGTFVYCVRLFDSTGDYYGGTGTLSIVASTVAGSVATQNLLRPLNLAAYSITGTLPASNVALDPRYMLASTNSGTSGYALLYSAGGPYWAATSAAGDITAVAAGYGLTGGGLSGAVTLAVSNAVVAGSALGATAVQPAGLAGYATRAQVGATSALDRAYAAGLVHSSTAGMYRVTLRGSGVTCATNGQDVAATVTGGGGGSATNWAAYPATQNVDFGGRVITNAMDAYIEDVYTSGLHSDGIEPLYTQWVKLGGSGLGLDANGKTVTNAAAIYATTLQGNHTGTLNGTAAATVVAGAAAGAVALTNAIADARIASTIARDSEVTTATNGLASWVTGKGYLTAVPANVTTTTQMTQVVSFPNGLKIAGTTISTVTQAVAFAANAVDVTQVITAGSTATLQFSQQLSDSHAIFNPATYTFTPNISGLWMVTCSTHTTAAVGSQSLGLCYSTGTLVYRADYSPSGEARSEYQASALLPLIAGSNYVWRATNGSGSSVSWRVVAGYDTCGAFYVGPTVP